MNLRMWSIRLGLKIYIYHDGVKYGILCTLPFIRIIDAGNLGNNDFIAACDLFTFQSEEAEEGTLAAHCFVDLVNKYQGSLANARPVLIRKVPTIEFQC